MCWSCIFGKGSAIMRGGQKKSLSPSCPLTSPPAPVSLLGAARPSRVVRATISIFPSLHFFSIFLSSPSSRSSSSSSLPLISPPSYPVRPSIIGHQRIAGLSKHVCLYSRCCRDASILDHLLVSLFLFCDWLTCPFSSVKINLKNTRVLENAIYLQPYSVR